MHPLLQGEPHPLKGHLNELSPYSRLPRLDLAIDWPSSSEELSTSIKAFFAGPWPEKETKSAEERALKVEWVRGKLPGRAFLASSLWHVIAIWILTLPIWGFLPKPQATLAPVEIEYDLYDPPDLPNILLRTPAAKPSLPPKRPDDTSNAPVERGADAYHPRQTIVSIPVKITHPRQTLIEPEAPPTPPKIVPQLPNVVQWAEREVPKLQIPVSPTASAPKIERKNVQNVEAPEVANNEKNPGPLNIAPSAQTIPHPAIPVNPMSAMAAPQRQTRTDSAVAPEIGASSQNDANLRRLIALSATPGPPAPVASIPEGNLAARISISPEGAKPGASSGVEHGSTGAAESAGSSASGAASLSAGANGGGAATVAGSSAANGAGSLPAAISISGGANRTAGGGIAPSHALNLKPRETMAPAASAPRGPVNVAALDPSMPPEKILSGKEVYTLHINTPNLTSATGSWIMNFAQLDEDANPPFKPKGQLAGPEPTSTADPEYPPDMIKEHVQGEVVLYAIIRKDGSVDSIQIVRGLEPQLDRNAIAALAKWKFRPGTRAGAPVDLEAVIHIPFLYRNPRE